MTSQEGAVYAKHPTPKCHSVEMFVWHHPRRAGQAARSCSREPGSRARGAGQAAAAPKDGAGGGGGAEWPRPAAPAPPRLLPGGPRQGRGREVGAERRGADGEGAGGAGPNHMAQTAQAARHLFLSLSRTSAPIPPHRRPLPGPIPGPTRGRPLPPSGDTHFSPEATSSLPSLLLNASVSPGPSLGLGADGAAGGDAPDCCCCCCCVPPLPSSCRISEGELDSPRARGPAGRPPPPHHG